MVKIKAIIFDLDGVLVDAKDWHFEALNNALSLFGTSISRYDHLVTYDGLPTRRKLEMLSLERGLPESLHDFICLMKQQYTIELIFQKCKPIFIHEYALSLFKQDGYKLACCSNSVRQTVDLVMEKLSLSKHMEFTMSNEDVDNAKPDPEIYHAAFARLDLQPEDCLIVEDNINGIAAAKASGAEVFEVDVTSDVNYQAINEYIQQLEGGGRL